MREAKRADVIGDSCWLHHGTGRVKEARQGVNYSLHSLSPNEDGSVIRLIATDLDGTIVHADGTVSARTLAAFDLAIAAGARVVFVTGRPPRWMAEVAEVTGHRGVAICANGAFVYDMEFEAVTETFAIAPEAAQVAAARLKAVLPHPAFAVESLDGFGHDAAYVPRWDVDPLAVAPIEKLIDRPLAKLLVRDESLSGDEMLRRARPALTGHVEVTHSNVNDCLLEISALGVSKATTLARLAVKWGIAQSEVAAFGDMPNDLEMVQWAGHGYAMANSHPEVLAAADQIAPTIHEDGVAHTIEQLLNGG